MRPNINIYSMRSIFCPKIIFSDITHLFIYLFFWGGGGSTPTPPLNKCLCKMYIDLLSKQYSITDTSIHTLRYRINKCYGVGSIVSVKVLFILVEIEDWIYQILIRQLKSIFNFFQKNIFPFILFLQFSLFTRKQNVMELYGDLDKHGCKHWLVILFSLFTIGANKSKKSLLLCLKKTHVDHIYLLPVLSNKKCYGIDT